MNDHRRDLNVINRDHTGVRDETHALVDEFDTVANWTVEALARLPAADAIPGACRGSGNPASLAWLAEALEVDRQTRFLDLGGGLGGPGAWLKERYGATPVVADPMGLAAKGGHQLFGLPAAVAWSDKLPFADNSFDAAWVLGVLSTLSDKAAAMVELRRVLVHAGRLGLLEYLAVGGKADPNTPTAGNEFIEADTMRAHLEEAGFLVVSEIDGVQLPTAPLSWITRSDRVKERVAEDHGDDRRYRQAVGQEREFAQLLSDGKVTVRLIHAVTT